jgi:8-oxo-dGTP pyrophosphatase MutT (NUDIX family)
MERYQTLRAYSAGGVVFRLSPLGVMDVAGQESRQLDMPVQRIETKSETPESDVTMIEVALVGRSHVGIWALPKGTPEPGETIEQVAIREAQEETGLQVRIVAYIGHVSYSFIREQVRYYKQVRHFLLEAIGGDTALHDHEYDVVSWFPLQEASRLLTYQNEVHILYQAEELLHRRLQHNKERGSY